MQRFAQLVWGKNYRSVRKTTYRIDGQKLITRQHLPRLYSRTFTTTFTNSLIKKIKNVMDISTLILLSFAKREKNPFLPSPYHKSWFLEKVLLKNKTKESRKLEDEKRNGAARMRCSQNKHKWIRSHLNTQAEQEWNEGEKRGQLPKLENGEGSWWERRRWTVYINSTLYTFIHGGKYHQQRQKEKKKRSEKDCKVRQLLQRRIIFRLGDEIK